MLDGHKKVLVLAPHTDDGEFGCGGTMAKFLEEGKEVFMATFSLAEKSVSEGLPRDILEKEVKEASKVYGLKESNLRIYRYEVRKFSTYRQEILEDLVSLQKELNPDIVFMPSTNDLHQDHYTIAMEGLRAFKRSTILSYEIPWNNISFKTTSFVFLEERHIAKKLKALSCYKSQAKRYYANEDFIRSLAMTRGTQIGVKYAETFDVMRWVIK